MNPMSLKLTPEMNRDYLGMKWPLVFFLIKLHLIDEVNFEMTRPYKRIIIVYNYSLLQIDINWLNCNIGITYHVDKTLPS